MQRFRIGTRLAAGFGGLLVVAAVAVAAALWMGAQGQASIGTSARLAQASIETVQAMRETQLSLVSSIRSAGLQTDSGEVNREVAAYRAGIQSLQALEADFARQDLAADERASLERAGALRQKAIAVADEAVKLVDAFQGEEAAKLLSGDFSRTQAAWAAELAQLVNLQKAHSVRDAEALTQLLQDRALVLVGVLVSAALGVSFFAVALTRSVTRPLHAAAEAASQVAAGDLTVRLDPRGKDEAAMLLRSLQTMTGQLAGMVHEVRSSAESIATASSEISMGNLDLSNRTEQQATALQETSASLSGLSEAVSQNAAHADDARRLADRTSEIAANGGAAMGDMVETMGRISDSSRRIAEIIAVIDGIAFQTNILALNAAVEAARAGEQGRGFAVVASEVRALAQRVSAASKEVRVLIGESSERVDAGARLVGNMGQTMQELVDGVGQVRGLVGAISSASVSQGEGIRKIDGAVSDIDGGTQQNAALVEQMAAASQSLSGQTRRLTALVGRFRIEPEATQAT